MFNYKVTSYVTVSQPQIDIKLYSAYQQNVSSHCLLKKVEFDLALGPIAMKWQHIDVYTYTLCTVK